MTSLMFCIITACVVGCCSVVCICVFAVVAERKKTIQRAVELNNTAERFYQREYERLKAYFEMFTGSEYDVLKGAIKKK